MEVEFQMEKKIEILNNKNYNKNEKENGIKKINNIQYVLDNDNIDKDLKINIKKKENNELKRNIIFNIPSISCKITNNKYKDLINDFLKEMMDNKMISYSN